MDENGDTYVSSNNGFDWAATTQNPSDAVSFAANEAEHLAANVADNTVVAVGENASGDGVIAYSNDSGDTWNGASIINDLPDNAPGLRSVYYCGGKIWIASGDKYSYTAGDLFNILVSYDNGETWRRAIINGVATTAQNLYSAASDGKQLVVAGNDFANLHSLALPGSMSG